MTVSVAEQLRLTDFDYDLPENLIAQTPSAARDDSRLMVLARPTGDIKHRLFSDVAEYLVPGDLLVLNDTKVFPCRLAARKPTGGRAEVFLVSEKRINLWEALVKGAEVGKRLLVAPGVEAHIIAGAEDNLKTVRFTGTPDIRGLLPELGKTPLPPYIRREAESRDRDRYQTVYASHEGAVAAPTAGLHFTRELLLRLAEKGVEQTMITLHVGPGTFQPVKCENITHHHMLPERYSIPEGTAAAIARARSGGRRVIAVGTTTVRTLETVISEHNDIVPGEGVSRMFIYPGHQFRAVNGIITNFHLPKSTLLMLVSAFAGRERVLAAYRTAVSEQYRFYSYGDAMVIL